MISLNAGPVSRSGNLIPHRDVGVTSGYGHTLQPYTRDVLYLNDIAGVL
jgi:hypothetical protein